ncbi:thioesterase II family protein [Dactylosporangium sp. CA-139114]|uniref:thioesterase II family protein n=1 Tax=Dactylosporangium sp. CA-139114 TaxID=3239931 RepID=UPI003D99EDF8
MLLRTLDSRAGAAWNGPDAGPVTCFLLHHAGGSAASFAEFPRHFPPAWRLRAVELPGRGSAIDRAPCIGTADAVAQLLPLILAEAEACRFAVFGHSLGALVAYELVRALERAGTPPAWLGVSAMPGPALVRRRFPQRRDRWPRERLVEFIRQVGGTPVEMLDDEATVDYIVKVLRQDLAVVDTYEFVPGNRLGVPLSVFWGDQDPLTERSMVEDWRHHCAAPVEYHCWPGGHFFLFDQVPRLAEAMTSGVRRARLGSFGTLAGRPA